MELIKNGQWNSEAFDDETQLEDIVGFNNSTNAKECLKYIPDSFAIDTDEFYRQGMVNHKLQSIGMYCNLAWEWINPLADLLKGSKVLEVMSGRGWLSLALDSMGIDIIAVDDCSWSESLESGFPAFKSLDDKLFPTINLDAVDAIMKYGSDIDYVIMTWPPYSEDSASRVVDAIQKINPKIKLIYCGEGHEGCTADDDFFGKVELSHIPGVSENYKRRFGLYDNIYLATPITK